MKISDIFFIAVLGAIGYAGYALYNEQVKAEKEGRKQRDAMDVIKEAFKLGD